MSSAPEPELRSRCHGVLPLSGRLEPWQAALCSAPAELVALLEQYGSPLNVHEFSALRRNADELRAAAAAHGLELGIFAARKANKTLGLVDAALGAGLGIDLASEAELRQALERGAPAGALIITAAVKPRSLLELCCRAGATVALDNADEVELLIETATATGTRPPVALRLAPAGFATRFGLSAAGALAAAERLGGEGPALTGIHFHLDGYAAADRLTAAAEALGLIDELRARGHRIEFLDIGGGIPMSYLDSAAEWEAFWTEHRRALLGEREPLTYGGHGLGLAAHRGELIGAPELYPYHQAPIRGEWLERLLASPLGGPVAAPSLGAALRERDLELRCEPGRSLLDGCGLTAARVEFRKPGPAGSRLVGLAMNRTQCRSTSADFLVDPLLVPAGRARPADGGHGFEGYLVGAYCIERELLSWRRLSFPAGVELGDIVVFPNTAGYLMHILESASHQIPLARNVELTDAGAISDPIDAWAPPAGRPPLPDSKR